MKKNLFIFGLAFFIIISAFSGLAYAKTIYVPDNNTTIQSAVNNASSGDTIIVRDGTYTENVDVNKSLTLKSENGSEKTIVIAKSSSDHVFEITSDYVEINGFTVKGATGNSKAAIYLGSGTDHCTISNTTVSNNYYGIYLYSSSSNTLANNSVNSNSNYGIYLKSSGTNTLNNNTANLNSYYGIYLKSSGTNTLNNNTANSNSYYGIYLKSSGTNTLNNNTANLNLNYGIYLDGSSTNTLANNTANSNSNYGIYISSSPYTTIKNNVFNKDGIFIYGSEVSHYNSHFIENNKINGKPIYYYKNTNGIKVPEDAGQVILANTFDMTVENINASEGSVGIELAYTKASLIANNLANSNLFGIFLYQSSNNNLSNNSASYNINYGIKLESSSLNVIIKNSILNNNGDGIYFSSSSNNNLANNSISNNNGSGIYLSSSSSNNLANNSISYNNGNGIYLSSSSNNNLANNRIYGNIGNGIYLYSSYSGSYTSWNTIANNSILYNNGNGIYLYSSSNNRIYLNNFINNFGNVYSAISTNTWNSANKINYTYNGKTYSNYTGNYWSDYTGTDLNGDGIGDAAYQGIDNYPLMQPWETYFAKQLTASFTYSPENPVVNETITFNASASYDPEGNITSYSWDFGDNTTKTGKIVSHSYLNAGNYHVSLTVTNKSGAKHTATETLSVLPIITDSDGDGVPDLWDKCPNTSLNSLVNSSGCSVTIKINLKQGWNLISIPYSSTLKNASEMCADINLQGGSALEIVTWDYGWVSHVCGLPFNNFNIEKERGYFINTNASSTWIPS